MAEHARLGGQLLGDAPRTPRASASRARRGQRSAAIRLEEVLHEELQLPGQLLDVERDAVRQVVGRRQLAPRRCSVSMSVTAWR